MGFGRLRFRRSFGQVKSQFRGARPKFYPLFTGLLDTYAGASAAYSLRRLSKIASSVVRVRRASDNAEKDFTADDITDSSMVNWVNGQIVPPLDIRELDSNGERTGDLVEAAAAYSLRNLSASYTGSVVEVRRSSDDAEDSFTAAEVADGTLVTWVGAGNDGFVKNWYDQSGNNNHATQGTDASQPKIVDSGSLVSGGLDFDGVDDSLALSGSGLDIFKDVGYGQVFAVATSNETGLAFGAIFRLKTNTGPTRYSIGESNATNGSYRIGGRRLDSDSFDSTTASTPHGATQKVVTGFLNYADGEAYIYQNGVNIGTDLSFQTAGNTSNTSSFGGDVGGGAGGAAFDGTIQEIIIYNSDQSDNRTAIEANIGDHYDIDLPSGVDTGYDQVDGFVETWYDQSGNGNDATQQVSGNQPKIVDAGSLVSTNGNPTVDFYNNSLLETGAFTDGSASSVFSVINNQSASATRKLFYSKLDFPNKGSAWNYRGDTSVGQYDFVSYDGSANSLTFSDSTSPFHFVSSTMINGDKEVFINGTIEATSSDSFVVDEGSLGIGNSAFGNGFDIQEIIIYDSDQSANRVAIETNINNQYDIY